MCIEEENSEISGVYYMTVSIWITVVIATISLMAGFWIGRSIKWMAEETEERIKGEEETMLSMRPKGKRIPLGWTIGSPVSGTVRPFFEGIRCGALIQPEEGKLYAPVSGRIMKLYPMGRAMLIAADFGEEVLVKAGIGGDELCSMYYRSRVVQNEIIRKGKLILEFDKEGLEGQGVDVTITVSVETGAEESNVAVTQKDCVKAGEELIWG